MEKKVMNETKGEVMYEEKVLEVMNEMEEEVITK
jgi:hypothetical protein